MAHTSPARAAAAALRRRPLLGFGGPDRARRDPARSWPTSCAAGACRRRASRRSRTTTSCFGGVSPITAITDRQARALEAALRAPRAGAAGPRRHAQLAADARRHLPGAARGRRAPAAGADRRGAPQLLELRAVQAEPLAGAGGAGARRASRRSTSPTRRDWHLATGVLHAVVRAHRRGARDPARGAARRRAARLHRALDPDRHVRRRSLRASSCTDSATAVARCSAPTTGPSSTRAAAAGPRIRGSSPT